jgi:hypothetical protein
MFNWLRNAFKNDPIPEINDEDEQHKAVREAMMVASDNLGHALLLASANSSPYIEAPTGIAPGDHIAFAIQMRNMLLDELTIIEKERHEEVARHVELMDALKQREMAASRTLKFYSAAEDIMSAQPAGVVGIAASTVMFASDVDPKAMTEVGKKITATKDRAGGKMKDFDADVLTIEPAPTEGKANNDTE